MVDDGQYAVADHVADPPRCHTQGSYADDEDNHGRALVPRGVCQLQVVLVGAGAIQDLAHQSQDVDSGDDDGGGGDDRPRAVEDIGVLEGTGEDGHLGHEAAQTGQAEVGQTGNHIADGEEGHDLHQAVQLADITGVRAAVDHTDQGEEQGRHQAVRQHLQDGTRAGCLIHHQDGEEHQAAVRHGGVGVDILQVRLYAGREGSVDDGDARQDEEDPGQLVGSLGHEEHGDAEAAVASQLHQHAGVQHGHGRGRRGMTVGAPCVEGEEGTQHAEADERQGEPDALLLDGDVVQVGNLQQVHRRGARAEVDAQDADQQEGGAAHQHQRQLHGGVFLVAGAPYADQQVHRDQSHLVEHEHREQVYRDEEAEYAQREEGEPQEVFLRQRLQPPGGEGAGEYDDGRKQQHHYGYAVHAYRIVYVESRIPGDVGTKQHLVRSATLAGLEVHHGQRDGERQQGGGTCHHHRAYLRDVAAQPEAQQHQQGNENK